MKRLILYFSLIALIASSCRQAEEKKRVEDDQTSRSVSPVELVTKKINQDSTSASLYLERARLYLEAGEVNSALSDVNEALGINDNLPEAYLVLADAYMATGKLGSSLEALVKAEKMDPDNPTIFLKQAEIYLILREYGSTFEYIGKALKIDDYNPVAFFMRGYTLLETGDTLAAVRDFMKAIEQDQSYYEAFMQLGYLYSLEMDPLAVGYYRNAASIRPGSPEPYYSIGMYYQETGQADKAIEAYEQLLTVDSEYPDAYYNLGYIHLVYLQDFESASIYFSDVIERQPLRVDAYYNRAYSYELSGNYDDARRDYKKTLELDPGYEKAIEALNRLDRMTL